MASNQDQRCAGAVEEVAEDQPSRRVKLLCSYGGVIIPRPSDGALRYVGGDTRIVSVRRDVSLPELMRRAQGDLPGPPATLKYQLPDEELDALVSVSTAEDLENMMEEYDKLAAADGSAKIRTFLFGPADSGADDLHQPDDTGQWYIDAVNGIVRKDSFNSASSTQTSNLGTGQGGDTPDCSAAGMEGNSPELQSSAMEDSAALMCAGGNGGMLANTSAVQNLNFAQPEPPQAAAYAPPPPPPSYIEPVQIQYANQQHVAAHGGAQSHNVVGIPMHPYASVHIAAANAQQASLASSAKPIQESSDHYAMAMDDGAGRAVAMSAVDQNIKPQPPLSKLPPLQPALLHQQIQQQPLQSQGPALRLEDCYMCQKALPHAHSDTIIHDKGATSPSSGMPEANPVFYSLNSEDAMRQMATHRVVTGVAVDNVVEPKAESLMPRAQVGAYGYTQVLESTQYAGLGERQVPPKAENVDHARIPVPVGVVGLQGGQASYGMFMSPAQPQRLGDSLHQQYQPPILQSLGHVMVPPQYIIRQDAVKGQPGIDANSSRNANYPAQESLNRDPYTGIPYNFVRPVEGTMESLRLNPTEALRYAEQGKTALIADHVASKLRPEVPLPPQIEENGQHFGAQAVGNASVYLGNPFVNPGIVLDGNGAGRLDQLQSSAFDSSRYGDIWTMDVNQSSTMASNQMPYLHNVETVLEPPIPSERLRGVPVYSSNVINNVAIADWKEEVSAGHLTNLQDHISTQLGSNAPTLLLPTGSRADRTEFFQEPVPSDSFVYGQGPSNVVDTIYSLPPRPTRVISSEALAMKDSGTANFVGRSNDSNVASLLEEGTLYHLPETFIRQPHQETVSSTRGSAEEQIKQDLQTLAQGVASSVLQSFPQFQPLGNASAPSLHETTQIGSVVYKESGVVQGSVESQSSGTVIDEKLEDIKLRQGIFAFPITEDIGRLQIIKNSDLEELRELDSGTFGTVYHGKWRGSDVAIKRINDRCFAGKPSEQDRMRADFWNEACKLADLHHPNVVAFYGVVLDGPGGSVATVTEYMVNGSLRHALQRNDKTLDRRKRLLISMDVAFGMEYLHGKNIVHFDLKSDNLLVNLRDPQRPICKVGDLGLSKVKCQTFISGGVRGTLAWMAPELLNGSSSLVSEKVDVFSFGIVMWELLTGEEPYADLHYGAIIGGIVSNTLRPPVPESCDPEWKSLMDQCWSSEPPERPTFTEIASRLRSMASSLPQKGQSPAQQATQPQLPK